MLLICSLDSSPRPCFRSVRLLGSCNIFVVESGWRTGWLADCLESGRRGLLLRRGELLSTVQRGAVRATYGRRTGDVRAKRQQRVGAMWLMWLMCVGTPSHLASLQHVPLAS
jgi:hypothetical protein